MEARSPRDHLSSYVPTVLWQRRDLRRQLGLVPDALDESAPDTPDLSALS